MRFPGAEDPAEDLLVYATTEQPLAGFPWNEPGYELRPDRELVIRR